MYTTLFWCQAAMQFILFWWLVRIWRTTGAAAAAVLIVPQFGLVYDNLMVAAGSDIGLGPLLEALSWPRFWIHWLMGAWLIIAAGAVLRMAGVRRAQSRWAMGGFCLLTVALMAYDLPHFWSETLYPVCEKGLVRYSTAVSPKDFCFPDQVALSGGPPIAAIMTCLVVIACGIVLWRARRFPWMFLGALLMFLSASPPLMRLKLDNFGEVLIAGGVIWAVAAFAPRRAPRDEAAAPVQRPAG